MWNSLWYSLGRGAAGILGGAARSTGATPDRDERDSPRRLPSYLSLVPLLLYGTRLRGAATAALRRVRTVLIYSGIQVAAVALAQMLSRRRSPSPSVEVVEEQAERIAQVLRERDIVPDRLGIDGIPGSGKSTLARALAERLDMEWKSLDYGDLGLPENLSSGRVVYEHYRLFRTQDVDAFDAIVYIDEPVERSRAKVRRRGRGLILAAVLDYDKLKEVGKLAFDVCEGEPVVVSDSHLILKVKPPEGFRAVENIANRLSAAGLDSSSMSKEEMLFLLAYGERRDGLRAYFLPLVYVTRMGRLAAGLCSAGRRFVTVLCADDSANHPLHLQGGARPPACG